MLRIVQQTSVQGAKGYYAAGYYAEGGDEVGEWGGRGAEMLGLQNAVTREAFCRLCENRHPATGERLTPRTKGFRRVGYDVSFHVPKSVSVVFEWGRDPEILAAFRRAVRETMADIEADARSRVRVGGGDGERATGNLVHASFVHRTSRPVGGVPDPHLHCHVFVFNATLDPVEGRWKAVDLAAVKRDAPYFEALFHSRLAAGLLGLGYEVTRTSRGWELVGVPARVVEEFSRRSRIVEERARTLGVTDPRAKDRLGATTREVKGPRIPMDELRVLWASRLTKEERQTLDAVCAKRITHQVEVSASERVALAFAVGHLLERRSVVSERALLAAALRFGVGRVTPGSLRGVYPDLGILCRERDGVSLVTTREVLAEEAELLAFARSGRGACVPLVPTDRPFRRDWLTDEQRSVVRSVLGSTDRVILIRGAAGTGKTALTQETVEAIEEGGRQRVVALAPSADASRGLLRSEGFADADTVARFLVDPEFQARARGGVIWVDEAGLLGSRTMARLFKTAATHDSRVVLSGDKRQHAPVERGTVLQLLETEAGLVPAELTSIRRQRGLYREAVGRLAVGRVADGFALLDGLGWVVELPAGELERRLARDYLDTLAARKTVLVVSPTHVEGKAVTAAIRSALRGKRLLDPADHHFLQLQPLVLTEAQRRDAASFEIGHVVEFHRPAPGVAAGTRLNVVAVEDGRVIARFPDGARHDVPLDLAARFEVFRVDLLPLAVGDRVRVTRNGRTTEGNQRVNNGAIYSVAGFTRAGVVLDNGWVLNEGYGHIAHGYCVTSHAAQGKTVDVVLVCQGSASLPASSPEQIYVSASRGRERVTVYTDGKEALREAVERVDPRPTATDLVGAGPSSQWRFWTTRRRHCRERAAGCAQEMSCTAVVRVEYRHPAGEVGR